MRKDTLERLLNEACELLILFEAGNTVTENDQQRIEAIFNEIKYAEDIDDELALTLSERIDKADDEAQDWNTFGNKKI
jgi:hypothetical protein